MLASADVSQSIRVSILLVVLGTCANLVQCSSDDQCGGLKGACVSGKCNCDKAMKDLGGYESQFAYLQQFCGHKTCTQSGNECFGMPCGAGKDRVLNEPKIIILTALSFHFNQFK